MTKIKLIYLAKNIDRKFNGLSHAMIVQGMREQYQNELQDNIKNVNDINEIITIIKNAEKARNTGNILTPNSVFVVNIDGKEYPINSNIELMEYGDFHRNNFIPYIEFDKSNIDISRELKRVNAKIQSFNSDECIKYIEDYIINPPKQYKHISHKPNKIFLCHSCDEGLKEFVITKLV